jgi:2-desacetyl-2-hydroxyethyl bacteriochlorophyllide A dehydrogenase
MKTQALVFPKANEYRVVPLTLAAPGKEDIVVRTLVTAISPGTERWILRGKHLGTQFPCVPGYHRVGIVESCGKEVRAFKARDIVYGSGNRWRETSICSLSGAHVGRSVSSPAGYRFLSPVMVPPCEIETLAFTILAGVANRGIRFCEVQPYQKVLVIGAGFIGVCAAQLCAHRRAEAVLLDQDPVRIAFVSRLLPNVLSIHDKDLNSRLEKLAPAGFDLLYDTVGHAETTDVMVRRVRARGKVLLQAQYFDREKCALDLDQIKIRELTVKTTCGIDDEDFWETAANIRARRLPIGSLITHRLKAPRDLVKGYTLLDKGTPFNFGIVFDWQ